MQQNIVIVAIVAGFAALAAVGLPLLVLFEETQARKAFERQDLLWERGQIEEELVAICGFNLDMRCRDRRLSRLSQAKDTQATRDALRFFSSAGKPQPGARHF